MQIGKQSDETESKARCGDCYLIMIDLFRTHMSVTLLLSSKSTQVISSMEQQASLRNAEGGIRNDGKASSRAEQSLVDILK
jgi:hypothetical protein